MKKVFLLTIFLMILISCKKEVYANAKLEGMPEMEAIQNQLERYRKVYDTEIKTLSKEFETKLKQYEVEAESKTAEVNQKRTEGLKKMQANINSYKQVALEDLQKKEEELIAPILKKYKTTTQKVKTQNTLQKGFIISDMFTKADDKTFLELLYGSTVSLELSAEEMIEAILRVKNTTKVYIKKNSLNNEENIIINKAEIGPTKKVLDFMTEHFSNEISILPEGMEMKFLDSGFGEYKDKFEYIFVKTFTKLYESDRFSYQYIISVNNENFHIVINTKDGLEIQDVIYEIN